MATGTRWKIDATATVTVSGGARIRTVADSGASSSTVLYTANTNTVLYLISETTGVDGYYWYYCKHNSDTTKPKGYVRCDMISGTKNTSGGGDTGGGGTGVNEWTYDQVKSGVSGAVFKLDSSSSHSTQGVKDLQQYLINIGWGSAAVLGTSSDMTVDGNFGSKTETAVKKFQYECEITQDGIVGKDTATRLFNAKNDSNFTTLKYQPIPSGQWNYSSLPSRIDDISLVARLICAEHHRNGYPTDDEDARAGIAKVIKNRKNSSINFNEVNGLKTYKAIIFGASQFSPATGDIGSQRMAYNVMRGTGNCAPWQQAIKYATALVNGQSITRAANVTNHFYFNGYTDSWTTVGKKNLVYYPGESTKQFTAFFNK